MVSLNRPGPNDATTSAGIGKNPSSPLIISPSPRRATTSSILIPGFNDASDSEGYNYRRPFPNAPLHSSTPCVLGQQLPLNGIPNTQTRPSPGGGNVPTPCHGHSRNGSGGSGRSTHSPSSKKSTRFSPGVTAVPPEGMHAPAPRGITPTRSALRQSPARTTTRHQLPPQNPDSVPNITIIHATPPSPTPSASAFGSQRPPLQPPNQGGNAGGHGPDDNDEGATPGQLMFRSRLPTPENHRNRLPGEPGFNDSGYFSPYAPLTEHQKAQMSAAQTQNQSQAAGNTTPHQNHTGLTSPANHAQQASPSQVNQAANQQQWNGPRIHTSWQASRPPHTASPVIPSSRSSIDTPYNYTNPTSFPTPFGPPRAVPTPARSTHRLTNADLAPINVPFHPVGGQPSARSHSRISQHATPFGPARTAFTPANGNGRGDPDVNSVVDNLLKVPPSSVAWQTPRGVLTWVPHPALPDSGPGLLGRGSGYGFGGPVRGGDWWTGGYPMPGACPTWTPGTWPPTAASAPATSGIRLAPWMIPNPCNAAMPHIMWDISQLPTTAKRITGNHVIVNLMDKLDDIATQPAVDRLVVVCQVGVAERFWGHIDVKASKPKGVTVWDVFNGVYEYFQKRIGRRELDRMKEVLGDERLEEKMTDAFYQRIRVTPALPGYEHKEGLKRVDCLGDTCFFWGMYATPNYDGTWQLNLGLVNRRRGA